jgi:hypothetical protein
MVKELDAASFGAFVGREGAVFVHFWAAWNGQDRTMKAIIDRVEPGYRGQVAFGSLDVDPMPHASVCAEHGVQGPPFYAYYVDGRRLETEIGLLTETELRHRLDRLTRRQTPIHMPTQTPSITVGQSRLGLVALGVGLLALLGVGFCGSPPLFFVGRTMTLLGPVSIVLGIVARRRSTSSVASFAITIGAIVSLYLPTLFSRVGPLP